MASGSSSSVPIEAAVIGTPAAAAGTTHVEEQKKAEGQPRSTKTTREQREEWRAPEETPHAVAMTASGKLDGKLRVVCRNTASWLRR